MTRYVAMINMPGFMPDSDPVEFDTFNETETYLLEQISEAFDHACENTDISLEKLESELSEARESLIKAGYGYFQGLYYGVNNV